MDVGDRETNINQFDPILVILFLNHEAEDWRQNVKSGVDLSPFWAQDHWPFSACAAF